MVEYKCLHFRKNYPMVCSGGVERVFKPSFFPPTLPRPQKPWERREHGQDGALSRKEETAARESSSSWGTGGRQCKASHGGTENKHFLSLPLVHMSAASVLQPCFPMELCLTFRGGLIFGNPPKPLLGLILWGGLILGETRYCSRGHQLNSLAPCFSSKALQ
uniref:Uncharacterized protein n=1 Tax=Anolis carolinensis TaxID=28377 RepID=A0A803T4E1_ANOCA